jgi:hypothetical protein
MSFFGMFVGAVGVIHAGWVRHERLKMDRADRGSDVGEHY